jgi:hypothetical protein
MFILLLLLLLLFYCWLLVSASKGHNQASIYKKLKMLVHTVEAVPLQAWSGPEGSRKLRFPDFMTTAQDGGKVVTITYRPPLQPPGNRLGTHFC